MRVSAIQTTEATPAPAPAASHGSADLQAWNRELNKTHAMAAMRARAGRIVTAIEDRRRRLVVERVLRHGPQVVVDVGCEDGWIAEGYVNGVVAQDGGRVVLADLDPDVLASTSLAGRAAVDTVVTDATAPDALAAHLGARGADVIVLSALLEHLPDPAAALRALAPLRAPGGRFVVYLPADGPILLAKRVLKTTRLGKLVRGLSLEPAPGHLHQFSRKDVARLLTVLTEQGDVVEEITFDPACLGYIAVVRRAALRSAVGQGSD